jgi:hypothetical protein
MKICYSWIKGIGQVLYVKLKKKYRICFCHRIEESTLKFLGLRENNNVLRVIICFLFAVSLNFVEVLV